VELLAGKEDAMKWPRGKYNGRRIVGFEVQVRFDLVSWGWSLPTYVGDCLSLGPVHVCVVAAYYAGPGQ
jgi:hypothetical protein